MAETAGTAGTTVSSESPITSDDIAAFASSGDSAGADSSPATSTPAETTPPPATEGAAASGPSVPEGSAGPIPLDRHKAVLEHARREAREAAERDWKQRFGWAERYQPQQVEQGARLLQWLNADPHAFMNWLQAQVGVSGSPSAPREPEGPPQPDLRAEDGTPVYSAPQLQKFLEWQRREDQKPLKEIQQKLAQREEQEKARQTAWAAKNTASGLLKYARESWPMFKELEGDVLASMQANPSLSFHDAYIRAFSATGPSKLKEQWTTEYNGTLARKQDASTAPPGKPNGAPRKYSEMDTMDVVKQEWESLSRKR